MWQYTRSPGLQDGLRKTTCLVSQYFLFSCYDYNKLLISKAKKSNHPWRVVNDSRKRKENKKSHLALSAGTKVEFPRGLFPIDVGYFFYPRTTCQRPNISTGVSASKGRRRGRMVGRSIFGKGSKSTRSYSQRCKHSRRQGLFIRWRGHSRLERQIFA